mgnify:FL=1
MIIQKLLQFYRSTDTTLKWATGQRKKSLDIGNNAENIPGEICASDSVLEAMIFSSHSAIDNEDCLKGEAIL